MMLSLTEFFKSTFFKRLILYSGLAFLAYQLRSFANLFLMIFFVTFIMNELAKYIHSHVSKKLKISEPSIILFTYLLVIAFFTVIGIKYIPQLKEEAFEITKFLASSRDLNTAINVTVDSLLNSIHPSFTNMLDIYDFNFAQQINVFSTNIAAFSLGFLKSIGIWIFNVFLIIVLSLFFLMEKNKLKNFFAFFKQSKISFVHDELDPLLKRFYYAFGSIIKAQFIVSLINTILTILALAIFKFSNLLVLGVMIFLLGLIPVAGTIFSTVPLILIGFKMGGIMLALYILIAVFVIHILGTYLFYPNIISNFVHLPIFITLIILLVSEHYFGPWGLIYGLPVFVFLLESIKIKQNV